MKRLLTLLLALAAFAGVSHADIQKDMKIGISIYGVPQSEQARVNNPQMQVDSNGNIRMWAVGTIRAAGLTTTQLSKKIESAYQAAQIYTNPSIQITTNKAEDNLEQLVTMSGKVNRPGPIQFTRGMTLAQAIAAAGGPSTFGTTKRVFVYREGKKYPLSPLTNDEHKLERV
jgi:polysaccharide export outer membrane protein